MRRSSLTSKWPRSLHQMPNLAAADWATPSRTRRYPTRRRRNRRHPARRKSDPMIKVNNLVKAFGAKLAVNDISFEVERGEVLGFLGPNGAGKSTTMRM